MEPRGPADFRPSPAAPLPGGAPAAIPVAEAVEEPLARVLAEIKRLRSEKAGWLRNLVTLALSILAFFWLGLLGRDRAVQDVLLIVGVILFHELGHYLGMRLLGYRDVRIFFIPFFGGATTGRATGIAGHKRAVVALLGPLPGLILAIPLLLFYKITGAPLALDAAKMLFLVNAFNLLPFFPLDGGRVVYDVLLCRSRWLEIGFRVLSGAALALAGLWITLRGASGALALVLMGGFVITAAWSSWGLAGVAEELRRELSGVELDPDPNPDRPIPVPAARRIVMAVLRTHPKLPDLRALAWRVDEVWDRVATRPPGVLATAAFLVFYGLTFCVALPVTIIVVAPPKPAAAQPAKPADGQPRRSSQTASTAASAGVTPARRAACPSVAGRTRMSSSRASRESPGTVE